MQMTLEEYIVWYNAEKARRPTPILRTQLDDHGAIEHIPIADSNDEWQHSTPPSSPTPAQQRRKSTQRQDRLTASDPSDVALGQVERNLLFGDLAVDTPDPSPPSALPTLPNLERTRKSVSTPSGSARVTFRGPISSPEKRLPYNPIPLPSTL